MHPLIRSAAQGRLPPWARVSDERLEHAARVAELLEGWARRDGRAGTEIARWTAAGHLHDALRDAPPAALRDDLAGEAEGPASVASGSSDPAVADLPDPVLHGPAVAARLRREGVDDQGLLRAVAFHTLGHPELDTLGKALYCADFLDPGRAFRPEWRAELRSRLPEELGAVTREVAAARLGHRLEHGQTLHPTTVAFWNRLADERGP